MEKRIIEMGYPKLRADCGLHAHLDEACLRKFEHFSMRLQIVESAYSTYLHDYQISQTNLF